MKADQLPRRTLWPAPDARAVDIIDQTALPHDYRTLRLATLEQAGLSRARRVSRNIFYAADTAQLGQTIGFLLHDCCAADPTVSACCGAAGPGAVTLPER